MSLRVLKLSVASAALLVAIGMTSASAQEVLVGLITKTDNNPFFVKMKEGAEAKAKELGITLQSYAGKYDGDNDTQVTAVENLIAAGAKGILITPSDTKAIVPTIQKAREAGILVIALDTPLDPIDAADATFTTAFARLGLVAEHGTAWLLPRVVGRAHAADLLLSGRTITGAEAEAIGLVNRAVAGTETLSEAMAYARELVNRGAPASWGTIKRQLVAADRMSLDDAYEQASALMVAALACADHREGVAAWREKRAPRFAPPHRTL